MLTAEQARVKREKAIIDIDVTVRQTYLPEIEDKINRAIVLGKTETEVVYYSRVHSRTPAYPEEFTEKSILAHLKEAGYKVKVEKEGDKSYAAVLTLIISWGEEPENEELVEEEIKEDAANVETECVDTTTKKRWFR